MSAATTEILPDGVVPAGDPYLVAIEREIGLLFDTIPIQWVRLDLSSGPSPRVYDFKWKTTAADPLGVRTFAQVHTYLGTPGDPRVSTNADAYTNAEIDASRSVRFAIDRLLALHPTITRIRRTFT